MAYWLARPCAALFFALLPFSPVHAAESLQLLGVQIADAMPAVKESLDRRRIQYKEVGPNYYTQGPMLDAAGAGFEIEGLKSVRFIFTPSRELTGAVLTLNKTRYRDLVGILKGKYQLLDEDVAFVGNQSAEFKAPGGTRIYAEAPHMSFEMTVSYVSEEMLRKKQETDSSEAKAKQNIEAKQL
jgi:hypothetical protein